jgi:hypothetical protein
MFYITYPSRILVAPATILFWYRLSAIKGHCHNFGSKVTARFAAGVLQSAGLIRLAGN